MFLCVVFTDHYSGVVLTADNEEHVKQMMGFLGNSMTMQSQLTSSKGPPIHSTQTLCMSRFSSGQCETRSAT